MEANLVSFMLLEDHLGNCGKTGEGTVCLRSFLCWWLKGTHLNLAREDGGGHLEGTKSSSKELRRIPGQQEMRIPAL